MAQPSNTPIDLREIVLSNQSFGPMDAEKIANTVADDSTQFALLRDAVNELQATDNLSPATLTRLGVCQVLIGRFSDAESSLRQGDGGALAQYYLGKVHFQHGDLDKAISYFEAAEKSGYTPEVCHIAIAEARRYKGELDVSMRLLDNIFGPVEQTAEYLYQRGATVAVTSGNRDEVVKLYQRAIQVNPRHAGALFGLALMYDRLGNDEEAFDLYQRSASVMPAHVGTLINLGTIYEDRNEYSKASACYRRVLEVEPDHPRAKLYAKDAAAGGNVLFDEDMAKRNERLTQLLGTSVSDFELSVRARNCLQKMGIRTLGDLTRTTEQMLLASKNFGETSLVEIRDILNSRGLQLGQFANEKRDAEPPLDISGLSEDQQALLERPISDLNLSVRARKCMVRLQLSSIGELVRKTGDDLLECKNFGVTSLNEVREKLTELGLKLRGD
jgi:DNA-directed RNA polymerase subunit alpha